MERSHSSCKHRCLGSQSRTLRPRKPHERVAYGEIGPDNAVLGNASAKTVGAHEPCTVYAPFVENLPEAVVPDTLCPESRPTGRRMGLTFDASARNATGRIVSG
jgi:hypothetical protein